jgi:flavodoxin
MSAKKKTVFVVYYSMYGHVDKLAREISKGLEKAGGKLVKNKKLIFSS